MNTQEHSFEKWSEIRNHIVNKIGKALERFEQRFTLDNSWFAERNLKLELHFLIHFRIGGINEEFVAYIQWKHPVTGFEKGMDRFHIGKCGSEVGQVPKNVSTQIQTAEGGPHGDYKAVFVDVVQLVEAPERIIPTLVRFGSVNRIYGILPHSP